MKAIYRRPKFLEILLSIRQEMAREADYDVDLFAEMVRSGSFHKDILAMEPGKRIRGKSKKRTRLPPQ